MIEWRYRTNRQLERLLLRLVWKLPRTLVMWCAIRVGAHATTGRYADQVVLELTFTDALQRWEVRR